ncbi:MAG: helix-turn-helix transcriptional regulator [Atopobiaceae bacterium]|nr:helix-turn-helix transcriptional regulator [Atopobiaceae bacterium]
MAFSDKLGAYIEGLACTPKEFAARAGISNSTLSRYLSGERVPSPHGETLPAIINAIVAMDDALDEEAVGKELTESIIGGSVDLEAFPANFRRLMDVLVLNGNRLAHTLGFDPSYISRIRQGQRYPANIMQFIASVSRYVARTANEPVRIERIMELTGCSETEASDPETCERVLSAFLSSGQIVSADNGRTEPLVSFLETLDGFDLGAFMDRLRFEEIEIPPVPARDSQTRVYTGTSEMVQAELDFLTMAIASPSTEDLIIFNDMPIEQIAKDRSFPRKIMMGMALLIQRGIRIHNIHDVYRPIGELIMGIEGWIPVYLTGQMDAYYLPSPTNAAFQHFVRSAGTVAVGGEAIQGIPDSGRFVVTTDPEEVSYHRTRATQLLSLAKPLMRVFREEDSKDRDAAIRSLARRFGPASLRIGEESFTNLSIAVNPGHYVIVTKRNSPASDILIEHPALVAAIENYEPMMLKR